MLEVTSHFNAASDPVRSGIHDTLDSGNYHVEADVGRQLVQIKSGIDHMRLDNNFLDSSQYWGNRFNTTPVRNEKYGEPFLILNCLFTVGMHQKSIINSAFGRKPFIFCNIPNVQC